MVDSPYRGGCGHPDEPERFCRGCFHAEHHGRCAECGRRCIGARFDLQIRAVYMVGLSAFSVLFRIVGRLLDSRVFWALFILLLLWLMLGLAGILLLSLPLESPLRRRLWRLERWLRAKPERDAAD